ncbi:hypothetical protein T4B_11954 [Trichinella pseudospiralis]|uniref:Uncharacterized protein n=1 Tax=Trichinella pseudospiralis TaxID=6337 RepID=A0A0V1IRY3_TRIPS|nr:hypothetical protein T4E_3296 [Trichinella pseudospiralis]KRZ25530.1 hypothetical protein T4B_11954 [Trichinella pseudospiralis]
MYLKEKRKSYKKSRNSKALLSVNDKHRQTGHANAVPREFYLSTLCFNDDKTTSTIIDYL